MNTVLCLVQTPGRIAVATAAANEDPEKLNEIFPLHYMCFTKERICIWIHPCNVHKNISGLQILETDILIILWF